MNTFNKIFAASCTGILLFGSIVTAGTFFDGWNIETDMQGRVVRMVLDNPRTPMGIEKQVTIEVNANLIVSGGHVVLRDGIEQSMSSRLEAETYWVLGNGPHVLWDYCESVGKLVTLSPNDRIQSDWTGRTVRFVSRVNTEVYGTLSFTSDADRYGITADKYMLPGACCGPIYFTQTGLLKLQTLK